MHYKLKIVKKKLFPNELELELVQNFCIFLCFVFKLFRHGHRTPADTYPNDPHLNETFSPYGWGHLTNVRFQFSLNTVELCLGSDHKFIFDYYFLNRKENDFYMKRVNGFVFDMVTS